MENSHLNPQNSKRSKGFRVSKIGRKMFFLGRNYQSNQKERGKIIAATEGC